MTTDLQRLYQDEFLAALRSGEYTQIPGALFGSQGECCVGGVAITVTGTYGWRRALGISYEMMYALVTSNNGGPSGQKFFGIGHLSFDELADWFKEQRDAWGGDLREWKPAS